MSKYDAIRTVIMYIQNKKMIEFQKVVSDILTVYYGSLGKTFESISFLGGDKANDGWIPNDGVFYAMYAPVQFSDSFKKTLLDKFTHDISALASNVFTYHLWGEHIKQFIFLCNTNGEAFPEDSTNEYGKVISELEGKYVSKIPFKRVNLDYIEDLLINLDIMHIERIIEKIGVRRYFDVVNVTSNVILEFLGNIQLDYIESIKSKKEKIRRISISAKIPKNGLDKISTRIREIQSNLFILDDAMVSILPSEKFSNVYYTIRDNIIKSYDKLSPLYNSIELYSKVLDDSYNELNLTPFHAAQYKIIYEFFLIKLFEECTIFES